MKKYALFLYIFSMLTIYVQIANGNNTGSEKVTIKVVNEILNPVGKLRFSMKIKNKTRGHIEIETDENGLFEIDAKNVGRKLQLSAFGLQGEFTEIKSEGTIVKCEHKELLMPMMNPWGHSRTSSPRTE